LKTKLNFYVFATEIVRSQKFLIKSQTKSELLFTLILIHLNHLILQINFMIHILFEAIEEQPVSNNMFFSMECQS